MVWPWLINFLPWLEEKNQDTFQEGDLSAY